MQKEKMIIKNNKEDDENIYKTCNIDSISTYCEEWLNLHKSRLKRATFIKYHSIVDKHINPYFKDFAIKELDTNKVMNFTDELLYDKKLSPKTVRDILIFLHEIIVYIEKEKKIKKSIKISYPKLEKIELRVLSVDEQKQLIQFLTKDTDIYKLSVLLALCTGLRIGEICALQWKHISIKFKTISVQQTVQRIKNTDKTSNNKTVLLLGTPKTSSSIRTIPLMNQLIHLLKFFQKDDPCLFVLSGNSNPTDPRKLQRKFQNYAKELNLKEVHFHTLRHTFATRYIELGCDVKTLSEILGHSNVSITMNRYVHPSLEFKRKNIEKLEQSKIFKQ